MAVGLIDWSDRLVVREWQFGMFCRDIIEWGKEVLSVECVEFIGDCSGSDNGWGSYSYQEKRI